VPIIANRIAGGYGLRNVKIARVSLYERLERELVDARRQRDELALSTLSLLKSEVVRASKEPGAEGLDDALVIRVAQREVKRREEAASAFRSGGRTASAEKEEKEAELIRGYLPAALGDEELERELRSVIAEVNPDGPQGFGQVMKVATARLAGRAEGGRIAATVKRLLA
jgi:uncharacterized protein YqeY